MRRRRGAPARFRLAESKPKVLALGEDSFNFLTKMCTLRMRESALAMVRAAHAAFPWIVTFDDHEIDNNWADEVPEQPDPNFLDQVAHVVALERRAATAGVRPGQPTAGTASPSAGTSNYSAPATWFRSRRETHWSWWTT